MISDIGYKNSIDLLHKATTPFGFVAAVNGVDNYTRIWSRDGIITSIAALYSGDDTLLDTIKATIETLFSHQHSSGFIPSNVTPGTDKVSYGGAVGRADNVPWAIIGLLTYTQHTGNNIYAIQYEANVKKAFELLDAWEYNGRGLVYVPQSGDWADEYIHHGYILYDQLLRIWALELAAKQYNNDSYATKALHIRQLLTVNFWNHNSEQDYYSFALARQMKNAPEGYWLMGFNPGGLYEQYDLGANALAILLQLGTDAQQNEAKQYLESMVNEAKGMLPSFSPVIDLGDIAMAELLLNHAYNFRNHPHEFHNGGLWAVWNGFAAAALAAAGAKFSAQRLITAIHDANNKSHDNTHWGFFENIHGASSLPIGVEYCTWSAAGAIIAEQAMKGNYITR